MTLIEKLKSYVETIINKHNIYKGQWDYLNTGWSISLNGLAEIDGVNILDFPAECTYVQEFVSGTSSSSSLKLRKTNGSNLNALEQTTRRVMKYPTTIDLSELCLDSLNSLKLSGFNKVTAVTGIDLNNNNNNNARANFCEEGTMAEMFPPNVETIEFAADSLPCDEVYYEIYLNAYASLNTDTMQSLLDAVGESDLVDDDEFPALYLDSTVYALIEDTDIMDGFLDKGWFVVDYGAATATSEED